MGLLQYVIIPTSYSDNGAIEQDKQQCIVGPFKTKQDAIDFNVQWVINGIVYPLLLPDFSTTLGARYIQSGEL